MLFAKPYLVKRAYKQKMLDPKPVQPSLEDAEEGNVSKTEPVEADEEEVFDFTEIIILQGMYESRKFLTQCWSTLLLKIQMMHACKGR